MIDFKFIYKLQNIKDRYHLDFTVLDRIKDFQYRPFTLDELFLITNIDKQILRKLIVKLKEYDYLTTYIDSDILNIQLTTKTKDRLNKANKFDLSINEKKIINELIEILEN